MAIDRRQGSKVIKSLRRDETPGLQVDPFPYIGIVKNNLDSIKSGRLQVYIPDLGGNEEDPKNWRTVRYASPFMGYTPTESSSTSNSWTSAQHTYGMWMVPPDVGVEVLCIFVAGDPLRGYWFACVNSNLSRHMLPGMASTDRIDVSTASKTVKDNYTANVRYPTTEPNEKSSTFKDKISTFTKAPKPIHEIQYNILREQGLDRDVFRGTITSSSQRESPSQVFGISTPGRALNDTADNDVLLEKLLRDAEIDENDYAVKSRKGGHTFVMDDGDLLGNDNLVRLRTAGGHQIMMNDSGNSLYIAHRAGTVWLEFDSEGRVLMYSAGGIAIRTEGTLDIRADYDINIDAGRDLNIRAGQKMSFNSSSSETYVGEGGFKLGTGGVIEMRSGGHLAVDAQGKISLLSTSEVALNGSGVSQNGGGEISVTAPKPLPNNDLSDTVRTSDNGLWEPDGSQATICSTSPTHEPYERPPRVQRTLAVRPKLEPSSSGGTVDATKTTVPGVSNPVTEFDIRDQPASDCEIGNLSKEQVTALFAQIGKSESGMNYKAVNTIGYVGKYQWGYAALIDNGLVKSHVRSNSQLNDPNSWTGKGCSSKEEFLNSPEIQEKLMCAYTKRNYNALVRLKCIFDDDPPETVAGMLMCAHLLGPGGAKAYRVGGKSGADAYGTDRKSVV